jgi:hypothetical protein
VQFCYIAITLRHKLAIQGGNSELILWSVKKGNVYERSEFIFLWKSIGNMWAQFWARKFIRGAEHFGRATQRSDDTMSMIM